MEPTLVAEWLRRLVIALVMLLHIQFAAFLIGIFGLGVIMEFFGILSPTGQAQLDRFARGLARTAILLYSTGAVLAIAFLLVMSLIWPAFWYIINRVTFWPLVLEAITFVLTILYLFPWYYTWDSLARFKPVHVSLGLALLVVANLQQSMIDVMAAYMLTPTPPQDLLRVFFNPTTLPLDMHRIVGDVSFAGFVVAGYAAVRTLRSTGSEQRAYYDWMGHVGLIAGLGFLFLQPAVGLAYLEEIRANTPGAFTTMMRGHLSWVFLVQVTFLGVLFFLSVLYMVLQTRNGGRGIRRLLRGLLIVVGLSALLLMQPYVIGPSQADAWINWVNPIGTMQPWKYIALAGLSLGTIGALLAYMGFNRRVADTGRAGEPRRGAQYALLTLGIVASAMMMLMGYIRENSRVPYLIYYYGPRVDQPGRFPTLAPTPSPTPASRSGATTGSPEVGAEGVGR